MALTHVSLEILKDVLDRIDDELPDQRRVLALGYPDILASPAAIRGTFALPDATRLRRREDSEAIVRWHGVRALTDEIVESADVFDALDFTMEVIDIASSRGDEAIVDLNEPVPGEYHGRYSLVMDHGTCEHCFNIGQAAKNVAMMVAAGGYVFHSNPVNMYNHGFYNLSPTWYHDFYAANGFELVRLSIVHHSDVYDVPGTDRFSGVPEGSSTLVVARRRAVRDIVWPMQTKYVKNPLLRG